MRLKHISTSTRRNNKLSYNDKQLDFFDELGKFNPNLRRHESTDWKWSFKDYPEPENIKVFSCFACGGGSTMGYKLAGCEVLGDLEIDERVNKVYVENHHPKYNYVMDIRDFNKLEDLPDELYHLDILDGSPPCTSFSIAGLREETWGKKKKFREGQTEQTLEDLSFHFIDTAKKLKPRVVIMENVEGLLLGEAWTYVQRIYKEFEEAGYQLNHYLMEGEKIGIPQTRHRVFFIAVRKDIKFDFSAIDMNFNYKPVLYGEIKQGEGAEINHDTELYRWLLKATPKDKRIGDTVKRNGEPEKLFHHRICWEENIVQTLTSAGSYFRGTEKTYISKEDFISIQTFPQDYNFLDQDPQYLLGMSVPPVMIKRLVTRLKATNIFNNKTEE